MMLTKIKNETYTIIIIHRITSLFDEPINPNFLIHRLCSRRKPCRAPRSSNDRKTNNAHRRYPADNCYFANRAADAIFHNCDFFRCPSSYNGPRPNKYRTVHCAATYVI